MFENFSDILSDRAYDNVEKSCRRSGQLLKGRRKRKKFKILEQPV